MSQNKQAQTQLTALEIVALISAGKIGIAFHFDGVDITIGKGLAEVLSQQSGVHITENNLYEIIEQLLLSLNTMSVTIEGDAYESQ